MTRDSELSESGIEAALRAYAEAEYSPNMVACERCGGKGYHHGFGEDGHDPDWCSVCGGSGSVLAKGEDERPLRAAILAYLAATKPASPLPGDVTDAREAAEAEIERWGANADCGSVARSAVDAALAALSAASAVRSEPVAWRWVPKTKITVSDHIWRFDAHYPGDQWHAEALYTSPVQTREDGIREAELWNEAIEAARRAAMSAGAEEPSIITLNAGAHDAYYSGATSVEWRAAAAIEALKK